MARAKKAAVTQSTEQRLPGAEDPTIPEIHQAAASLLDVRSRRIALTKEEGDAEKIVVEAMKKNDRDYYNVDGLEVTINHGKDKAKVAHTSSGGDE